MSDDTTRLLHGTTDAMVWAEQFCRLFDGKVISPGQPDWAPNSINEGTMVGWFANAMQTAVDMAVDRIVDEMPYVLTDRIRTRHLLEQLTREDLR